MKHLVLLSSNILNAYIWTHVTVTLLKYYNFFREIIFNLTTYFLNYFKDFFLECLYPIYRENYLTFNINPNYTYCITFWCYGERYCNAN